jgi:hypothetical protein
MNAKEQIIELIKNKIFSTDEMELQKALITAVENAIFDVPSEEEIKLFIYMNTPIAIRPKRGNKKMISPFTSNHAREIVIEYLTEQLYQNFKFKVKPETT